LANRKERTRKTYQVENKNTKKTKHKTNLPTKNLHTKHYTEKTEPLNKEKQQIFPI
jgi:hypothetical protein